MSAEQMRMELEAFVNTGLREGWHGWPMKNRSSGGLVPGRLRIAPLRVCRTGGDGSNALMGLPWALRMASWLW